MQHLKDSSKFFPEGAGFITDLETGYTIPAIAGGSDTEAAISAMLGGGDAPEPVAEVEEEEEEDDDEDQNFNGETFLQSIEDEELRNRLEPQVKRWDAGVTRRFQELHSQYKPYKELGDLEALTEAQELYRIINERPEDLYKGLAEALGYGQELAGQQGQPGPQGQPLGQQNVGGQELTPQQQQHYAQLPPEMQQKIDESARITETLAQAYLSDQKMKQQAAEDAELDSYIKNLKDEFGEFDEDYVMTKMLRGMEGPKAVKAYHKAIRKTASQEKLQAVPTFISGGGQVGQETVNVGELSNKDTKSLVAGLMAQAAQAGD